MQEIGNLIPFFACKLVYMGNEIFIADSITLGEKARLARLTLKLRQIDVASKANVSIFEVTALEKDRHLRKTHKERILNVLGLSNPEANNAKD